MLETESSLKPPQISGMFQKLALAFKTKTIEFFAEDAEDADDAEGVSLLDPAEEIITGQRVVVIKPDATKSPPSPSAATDPQTLISSLFATVESFRASYLHLQTAHAPLDAAALESADRSAVSHLRRLSDIKRAYADHLLRGGGGGGCSPSPSLVPHLEAQVQENQSLLRTFDAVINRLQSDIDRRYAEASALRKRLDAIEADNSRLSKKLEDLDAASSSSSELLLSVSLFDSVLQDACRAARGFAKILIDLMRDAGWDLNSAANFVHPSINYAKKGHNRYAILSYVCLVMFAGFDSDSFCLNHDGIAPDLSSHARRKRSLRQFVEHGYVDAMELLNTYPSCDFARFCEIKYQNLIHPGLESSLFGDFDEKEAVLNSWRASSPFYEAFVGMASVVWMLNKLAFSFDPKVGIFLVERGTDFSMVYMESVIGRSVVSNPSKDQQTKSKVGFTIIPGFRVGKTVIQCQVYLDGVKCAE